MGLVRKPTGEIKARLVAKDFNDGSWIDSFSSTPTQQSLRMALYLSVRLRWSVCAGDFSTAFLHADIAETDPQYIQPCAPVARPGEVWKLRKALYGLRVAPKLFQDHLTKMFGELGLKRSVTDPSVYFGKDASGKLDVLIVNHVDDPLLCVNRNRIDVIRRSPKDGWKR